jgi:hypothetical protein
MVLLPSNPGFPIIIKSGVIRIKLVLYVYFGNSLDLGSRGGAIFPLGRWSLETIILYINGVTCPPSH